MTRPQVFTIPMQKPFVDVLARGLLTRFGGDPLTLSQALVLVPTRRAARALQEALLRASDGAPLLLPRIRPVGDVEEEELLFTSLVQAEALAQLPPVMPSSQRLLRLAKLVMRWHRSEYGAPENVEQAARLALDLAALLDDVAREEISFDGLAGLVPEQYAEHWQVTLEFLQILTAYWPEILEEAGMEEPVTRRIRLLHLLAEQWEETPPSYPVIIAGTTGSVPATANLVRVVAGLPRGAVILPGLDLGLEENAWNTLIPSHPQWGLRQLLGRMKISRGDVSLFDDGDIAATTEARVALLRQVMLPPEMTDRWTQALPDVGDAIADMRRIDCRDQEEEAHVIALQLREVLEHPGKAAALVTPDRTLARRVAAILGRYGVAIDDSAGRPLAHTPPAVFLRLLAEAVGSRLAPVPLLALLKHPLAAAGMSTAACREATRVLERFVIRGVRLAPGIEGLRVAVAARESKIGKDVMALVEALETALGPMLALMNERSCRMKDLLEAHLAAAEALATADMEEGKQRLWRGDDGEQLAGVMNDLQSAATLLEELHPSHYAGVLETLLQGEDFRPRYGSHPRLHILSPMEARLQHYDRVILGGLNEGTWPLESKADPWMSRPMREQFGLAPQDKQVGQAAHDVMMLSCSAEVVLTRAAKVNGTPTVASRWLQRLDAVMAAQVKGGASLQDVRWQRWVEAVTTPEEISAADYPAPVPPVNARPRKLSVTQIEKLMKDPYAVYAMKVLELEKLDGLDDEPDASDFGNIIHDALEQFTKRFPKDLPPNALAVLLQFGKDAFADLLERPAVYAFWWPRFERLAAWIIEQEQARRAGLTGLHAEIKGEWKFPLPAGEFLLHAKMDRVEQDANKKVRIIDYKTGALPLVGEREAGIACQLPLEAVIVERGNAPVVGEVVALEYWRLTGSEEAGEQVDFLGKKTKLSLRQVIEDSAEGVQSLLAAYDDPMTAYPAVPRAEQAPKYNDYEHLERLAEWRKN